MSRSPKQREFWLVNHWNQNYPVGTPVIVTRDNGEKLETVTRSEAWQLGSGQAVISVKGISGCYSLHRVAPNTECSGQAHALDGSAPVQSESQG
jgi:hypothetical protein